MTRAQRAERWRRIRESEQFHNCLLFLIFVAVAAIFWFVVALNDNITETFRVRIEVQGVPDSVTFITPPPAQLHVTVRDKGTNILRSGVVKDPVLSLNFRDYAHDGIFRMTPADINAELKSDFLGAAQITSASLDSLKLYYTTGPGRRVPVRVNADLKAASGYVISGDPTPLTKWVRVYSYGNEADTVRVANTVRLNKSGLERTQNFDVRLQPLANVRIIPADIEVRVPVEPLVHKEEYVTVEVVNEPPGVQLLLFPSRVPVSFYVPMSRFGDDRLPLRVSVDYHDLHLSTRSRLPLHLDNPTRRLINVELKADSVEYTVVR